MLVGQDGQNIFLEDHTRSLRLQDRLGGHLVQGHVDAVAAVRERVQQADDYRLRIGFTPEIRRFIAFKGSVALQGVSLTVAAVGAEGFEVALIPETLERTTLAVAAHHQGTLGKGDASYIGQWVYRPRPSPVTAFFRVIDTRL